MKQAEFTECANEIIDHCKDLLLSKGDEYTLKNIDRLSHFKKSAVLNGTTPKGALAGMMTKHTISVYDMCHDKEDHSLEKWTEKIGDHINYLILLYALVKEEQNGQD